MAPSNTTYVAFALRDSKGEIPKRMTDRELQRIVVDKNLMRKRKVTMKGSSNEDVDLAEVGNLLMKTEPADPVLLPFRHSLIGSLFEAYDHHRRIALRSDDIWISIMISLAQYIDNHAEEMRSYFVDHDGKKELLIEYDGGFEASAWEPLLQSFSDEIAKKTKANIRDWVIPKFSTTTIKDRFVSNAVLMGAMKNYFSYSAVSMCGIREVMLNGTLKDWQQLRLRIDRLQEIAKAGTVTQEPLLWWHQVLAFVLDEFIASYQGKCMINKPRLLLIWLFLTNY